MIPTIDEFKNSAQIIQYFGLGFVQIKINEYNRFHFYHPHLIQTSHEDIHNHRCGFKSSILSGSLIETLYNVTIGDDYFVKISNCKKDVPNTLTTYKVNATPLSKTEHYKGSDYIRHQKQFHTVSSVNYCITELYLYLPKEEHALVLIENESELNYRPFKADYKESELWEMVEDCINKGNIK